MEKKIERRTFLTLGAVVLGGAAMSELGGIRSAAAATQPAKSQVFFTRDISGDGLLRAYSKINEGISGKVAIKLHSGEPNGPTR